MKKCKGDGEHCWEIFKNHGYDKKCCWCGIKNPSPLEYEE